MKTRIGGCIIGVLAAGLLLGSSVSSAEQVRWTGDEGEIATNILNLDAGAAQLDVDFEYGPARVWYSQSLDFDVDNVVDAETVTDAIVQALNDVILTEIQLVGGLFDNLDEFAIGYSRGSGNNVNVVIGSYDGADWVNSGTAVRDADTAFIVYAILTASEPAPELSVSPSLLTPAVLEGNAAADQTFGVTNFGDGTLSYSMTDDADWLTVSPSSGESTGETDSITVRYETVDLARGLYPATITVSDPNATNDPQTIDVLLIVTALPAISLSTTTLRPTVDFGDDAPQDTFTVTNSGGMILDYTVDGDVSWLSVSPTQGTAMPGETDVITVTYATAGLSDGEFEATITVEDPGAVNDPQTIEVTLTVLAGDPEISLSPTSLTPAVLDGDTAPDQSFTVTNTGDGTLRYSVADDADWLSVSPSSGESTGESDTLTVSYDTADLARGFYPATVTVSDPNASNDPQTIGVLLIVTALPAISLSTTTLTPETETGSDAPEDAFTVTNSGGLVLDYRVEGDVSWLSVAPPTGSATTGETDTITVTYLTAALSAGVFEATISVDAPLAVNGPQTIDVTLTVAAEPIPEISVSPTSLTPAVLEGNAAPDQTFTVTNTGEGTLSYSITDDADWLTASPSGGESSGESDIITVSYETVDLDLGMYPATITVSDPNASNDPQTIDVLLIVTELPAIALSTTALTPEVELGDNAPQDTFTVTNSGGLVLDYTVEGDESWLSLSPTMGTAAAAETDVITVTYLTTALPAGDFEATITVDDPGAANAPQDVDVTLTVIPEPSPALAALASLVALAFLRWRRLCRA